jgi:hypothetical protein
MAFILVQVHRMAAALTKLREGFQTLHDSAPNAAVPEHVRDAVRDLLPDDRLSPRRGHRPASLDNLIQKLFYIRNSFVDVELNCRQCHSTWPAPYLANDYVLYASSNGFTSESCGNVSTTFIVRSLLTQSGAVICSVCRCHGVDRKTTFRKKYPPFFVIEIPAYDNCFPSLIVDKIADLRPIGAGE